MSYILSCELCLLAASLDSPHVARFAVLWLAGVRVGTDWLWLVWRTSQAAPSKRAARRETKERRIEAPQRR
jgi:hypothetical protein